MSVPSEVSSAWLDEHLWMLPNERLSEAEAADREGKWAAALGDLTSVTSTIPPDPEPVRASIAVLGVTYDAPSEGEADDTEEPVGGGSSGASSSRLSSAIARNLGPDTNNSNGRAPPAATEAGSSSRLPSNTIDPPSKPTSVNGTAHAPPPPPPASSTPPSTSSGPAVPDASAPASSNGQKPEVTDGQAGTTEKKKNKKKLDKNGEEKTSAASSSSSTSTESRVDKPVPKNGVDPGHPAKPASKSKLNEKSQPAPSKPSAATVQPRTPVTESQDDASESEESRPSPDGRDDESENSESADGEEAEGEEAEETESEEEEGLRISAALKGKGKETIASSSAVARVKPSSTSVGRQKTEKRSTSSVQGPSAKASKKAKASHSQSPDASPLKSVADLPRRPTLDVDPSVYPATKPLKPRKRKTESDYRLANRYTDDEGYDAFPTWAETAMIDMPVGLYQSALYRSDDAPVKYAEIEKLARLGEIPGPDPKLGESHNPGKGEWSKWDGRGLKAVDPEDPRLWKGKGSRREKISHGVILDQHPEFVIVCGVRHLPRRPSNQDSRPGHLIAPFHRCWKDARAFRMHVKDCKIPTSQPAPPAPLPPKLKPHTAPSKVASTSKTGYVSVNSEVDSDDDEESSSSEDELAKKIKLLERQMAELTSLHKRKARSAKQSKSAKKARTASPVESAPTPDSSDSESEDEEAVEQRKKQERKERRRQEREEREQEEEDREKEERKREKVRKREERKRREREDKEREEEREKEERKGEERKTEQEKDGREEGDVSAMEVDQDAEQSSAGRKKKAGKSAKEKKSAQNESRGVPQDPVPAQSDEAMEIDAPPASKPGTLMVLNASDDELTELGDDEKPWLSYQDIIPRLDKSSGSSPAINRVLNETATKVLDTNPAISRDTAAALKKFAEMFPIRVGRTSTSEQAAWHATNEGDIEKVHDGLVGLSQGIASLLKTKPVGDPERTLAELTDLRETIKRARRQ